VVHSRYNEDVGVDHKVNSSKTSNNFLDDDCAVLVS